MKKEEKHRGHPYRFKTPDELRQACDGYFAWCEANPVRGARNVWKKKRKGLKGDEGSDDGTQDNLLPRPFTFEGLCLHIGIADWTDFVSKNKEREGFAEVIAYVRNRIRDNQISGGMIGIYSSSLTARLNGIAENLQVNEKPSIQLLPDELL